MSQTAKAQETARRISAAAAVLFAERGFEATTIAAVAESAKVATGTVMLHFGSKSQLATAVFSDHIAETVRGALGRVPGDELMDDLASFVKPIYRWYDDHGSFAPDLLREALFSDGPWAAHYAETVAVTIGEFANIVQRHTRRSDTAAVAESLLADYLLVLMQGLRGTFETVDAQTAHFTTLAQTHFTRRR